MSENAVEVVEVEVPSVDESAYPARPYTEALSEDHRAFLEQNHPEMLKD